MSKLKQSEDVPDKAASDFVVKMIHKIDTLTNTIFDMARLLDQFPLTHEQKKYLHIICLSLESPIELYKGISKTSIAQKVVVFEQSRKVVHADAELSDIIPAFFEYTGKDIASMHAALLESNYDAIQQLAHSMKGACGSYGFNDLSSMGKALEDASIAKDHERIQDLLKEVDTYIEHVEVVYE
ncbi:MAG: Hpt domain-containing protein [Pseudomonadota bacterium]